MDNLSQTKTEGIQGGKTRYSRNEILKDQLGLIEYEKHREELETKLGEFYRTYGNDPDRSGFFRQEGMNARLSATPPDLSKCQTKQDINCYNAGFLENGNRAIHGRIEKLTEEQLYAIAQNDYNSGLTLDKIPDVIKNNSAYTQGYMMASIMDTSKGKGKK